MENGIRYIFLEGASPVSIPGLLANNVFYNDCSAVASSQHYWRENVYLPSPVYDTFNPSCPTPGILVFNFLINSGYFLHLEVIPSISKGLGIPSHCWGRLYFVYMVCYLFRFNPGACLCVDIPQRPFNHLRIQPLIVTKCFSLFFRGLQLYFEIVFSYGKVARDWLSVCLAFAYFSYSSTCYYFITSSNYGDALL